MDVSILTEICYLVQRIEKRRVEVDYCDLSKFPSCCEQVDVFCLFEALECW